MEQFPYLERATDEHIKKLLETRHFVLVVGSPLSGKTRSVVEILQTTYRSYHIVIPAPEDSPFDHLQQGGISLSETAVLLDDMEHYLDTDWLRPEVLDTLDRSGALVIGTMRSSNLARFLLPEPARPPWAAVLDRFERVHISEPFVAPAAITAREGRLVSTAEIWARGQFAISAFIKLVESVKSGTSNNPFGAALISAMADLRRIGFERASDEVFYAILPTYLEHTPDVVEESELRAALAWATTQVGGNSLLIRDADGMYTLNDYAFAELARESNLIPQETLSAAEKWSDDPDVVMAVAALAYSQGHFDVATRAWNSVFRQQQAPWWTRAGCNLAAMAAERGNPWAAAALFLEVANASDSQDGAFAALQLGFIFRDRGDLEEASRHFVRALQSADDVVADQAAAALGRPIEGKDASQTSR
jgi:hypothetical protein